MIDWLAVHGLELALGVTVVLAIGSTAVAVSRGPVQRQALARVTLAATWCAAVLLALPLPRALRLDLGVPTATVGTRTNSLARQAPTTTAPKGWTPPSETAPLRSPGESAADPAVGASSELPPSRFVTGATPTLRSAEPPAPSRATRRAIDVRPWAARGFLALSLALALHLLVCAAILGRTLRAARRSTAPHSLGPRFQRWCRDHGVRARVYLSDAAPRPFCCGIVRNSVVLPRPFVARDEGPALESVVRHELAHLARRDPLVRLAAAASAPLLFWNPLYWWLAGELRRSAELIADDTAATHVDKRRYVADLLSLAERSTSPLPWPCPSVLGSRRDFLKRMETLLMRSHRLPTSTTRRHTVARTACAALVVSAVSVAWGHAPAAAAQEPAGADSGVPMLGSIPLLQDLFDDPATGLPVASGAAVAGEDAKLLVEVDLATNRARVVHPRPTTPIDVVFSHPHELGVFLYVCADNRWSVDTVTLSQGGGDSRRVRLKVDPSIAAHVRELVQEILGADLSDSGPADPYSDLPSGVAPTQDPWGRKVPVRDPRSDLWRAGSRAADPRTGGSLPGAGAADPVTGASAPDLGAADPLTGVPAGPATPDIDATVVGIEEGMLGTTLLLDRGSDHGVTDGATFEVYSGAHYKGRAVVRRVSAATSVAVLERPVPGTTVREGDDATTKL